MCVFNARDLLNQRRPKRVCNHCVPRLNVFTSGRAAGVYESQVMRNPDCTLWRGVAEDLESGYRERVGQTVVFWGYTSTTRSMDALDAFIPADSSKVC